VWNKRNAIGLLLSMLLMAPLVSAQQVVPPPLVKVWKTPTCGCCGKWVKHMEAAGFRVEVINVGDVGPIRTANGVPPALASCHTALVGGYVIEGHVPASDVRRLLKEKPGILGLAAPGMPAGSPGMDVPGSPPYQVISIGKDGKTAVYATHAGE
jgi:hypothetical protein